jgi:hypothetical protein
MQREDENLCGCVGAGMPALCEVLPLSGPA